MAAALSVAPTSATTLTPPSSSHGNDDPWAYAVGNVEPTKKTMPNPALSPNPAPQNAGATGVSGNNPRSAAEMGSLRADGAAGRSQIADYSPPWGQDEDEAGGVPNGVPNGNGNGAPDKRAASDRQDGAATGGKEPEENSKWIHRDKLARIENEELQAAGLVLPRPIPRPARKDRSTDRLAGRSPERGITRPKTRGSDSTTASATTSAAAAAAAAATTSRIPVAKFGPTPTLLDSSSPEGYEGDSQLSASAKTAATAAARSRSVSVSQGAGAGPGTPPRAQPTSTKRSVTADSSPKKKPAAGTNGSLNGRKPPAKTASTSRPRTRGVESRSGSVSNNRPTTRAGDLSPPGNARKPEGEPPWMISAYKPDPRLPPDQQLLPTVARRLQQEKWEKEGKFGSVYDKEFRPLTDDGLLDPPEPSPRSSQPPPPGSEDDDRAPSRQHEQQNEQQQPDGGDWPLRPDPDQSPPPTAAANRASSYSTMPKISDKPGIASSPQGPKSPQDEMQRQLSQRSNLQVTRMPEDPEPEPSSLESRPEKAKASCLCCIVM